jgi:heme/copper-type cytochrome/quinol oxidase subunit 2
MRFSRKFIASSVLFSGLLVLGLASRAGGGGPKIINVIADKDNRFKIPGQASPVITVKANEVIKLHITAYKATEWDKDGTVHSFTVKELKDQGWDLRLKEGVQDFTLAAPTDPGEYLIECTVKCGNGHDDMRMKLIVTQ